MKILNILICLASLFIFIACNKDKNNLDSQAASLNGTVSIDGSSTVFPITEAVAEEFRTKFPKIRVNIGVSGTGGGFKKFIKKETDINNASRRVKQKQEALKLQEAGIDFLEIPVAYDGLTIVINKENNFATSLTVRELKKIWDTGSQIKNWNQVRSSFPNEEIKLFGPGTDSGTFDYFTKAINGKSGQSRSDYQMSEDDHVIVNGVKGSKYSLGYFGYAYYKANSSTISPVAIDNGEGAVAPTEETINNGSYKPLARPIFIYVVKSALKRPEVYEFVKFYIESAASLVQDVGYIALPAADYAKSLKEIEAAR